MITQENGKNLVNLLQYKTQIKGIHSRFLKLLYELQKKIKQISTFVLLFIQKKKIALRATSPTI